MSDGFSSIIKRSLRALKLSFSFTSLALISSSSFILASISSILTRFLSLAFWAATLFLSFLLISFSSGVRWSRLALFLAGCSSKTAASSLSTSLSLLTLDGGVAVVAEYCRLMALAGTMILAGCFNFMPPGVELLIWCMILLGKTIICWCCPFLPPWMGGFTTIFLTLVGNAGIIPVLPLATSTSILLVSNPPFSQVSIVKLWRLSLIGIVASVSIARLNFAGEVDRWIRGALLQATCGSHY